jgi:hypothetical protein
MATKIDKEYNRILHKIVEPKTGIQATYGDDLNRVGRKLLGTKLKGVFPSDKIPTLNDLTPYAILNLDNSKQSGSHWIAIAKRPNKNELLVYDSFGRGYKKIIPSLKGGNMRVYNTDPDPEQKVTEDNCGARCCAFLICFDMYGWEASIKI